MFVGLLKHSSGHSCQVAKLRGEKETSSASATDLRLVIHRALDVKLPSDQFEPERKLI